jgi:hypothetical protein
MNPDDHPALSALRQMNRSALVAEWTRLLGGPPPLTSCREFLLYTLAWHRQAEKHGGSTGRVCSTAASRDRTSENLARPNIYGHSGLRQL